MSGTGLGGCLGQTESPDPGGENERTAETAGPGPTATDSSPARVGLGPDTFERLSDLEVQGGTLVADTDRNVTGSQCAAVRTGADGAWLHVPLDEPMDFSNARLSCHLAVDGTAPGSFPYADLRDEAGNRFRTRTVARSHEDLVRVDFGVIDPRWTGPRSTSRL